MRRLLTISFVFSLVVTTQAIRVFALDPSAMRSDQITMPEAEELILHFLHTSATAKNGEAWIAFSERLIKAKEVTVVHSEGSRTYIWGPWQVDPSKGEALLTSNRGQLRLWFKRTEDGIEVTKTSVTRFLGRPGLDRP